MVSPAGGAPVGPLDGTSSRGRAASTPAIPMSPITANGMAQPRRLDSDDWHSAT